MGPPEAATSPALSPHRWAARGLWALAGALALWALVLPCSLLEGASSSFWMPPLSLACLTPVHP